MRDQSRWDRHFLRVALECASMSKDPSTRVGAVIVRPDLEIRSTGFNGFPRGVADTEVRLQHRDLKLKLVVHAERNAILNAARIGVSVKGCMMYLAATDGSREVWGGPPCTSCTIEVVQSGISEVVSYQRKQGFSKWREDLEFAELILAEVGMPHREVAP